MSGSKEVEDAEISPEEEAMLNFISQKGFVRWKDMINEFVTERGWCKSGKFNTHWKNIRQHLMKVKNETTGREGYAIENNSQVVVSKAVLRTQINNGKINSIEISPERFEKVAEQLKQMFANLNLTQVKDKAFEMEKQFNAEISVEKQSPSNVDKPYKQGLIDKIKGKPNQEISESTGALRTFAFVSTFIQNAELEKKLKKQLTEAFERVKIQIITSPGETAPVLTDDDIINLLTIVFPKTIDENKGKPREKPFQLIVSFPNFKAD